jgi:excisionase family DNA binding protein
MHKANYSSSTQTPTICERLKVMTTMLDSKQVAPLLCISGATLRLWVSKAEVPFFRIGRSVRFDPVQLAVWLERRQLGL